MAKQIKPQKKRNPVALSPLLKKGGVHQKTNKAKRNNAKRDTEKTVAQYQKERHNRSFLFLLNPI